MGFRYAMCDRLRAVSCASEMIDQIGGWSSGKIGEGYGEGFSLIALLENLSQVSELMKPFRKPMNISE